MKALQIFSIGCGESIGCHRYLIAAPNLWEAMEYFRTIQPGDCPFELSVKRYRAGEYILVTRTSGVTEHAHATELISLAESVGRVPSLIGRQDGLQLFVVDGKYGIIAYSEKGVLEKYKAMVSNEEYLELLVRMKVAAEYEYDINFGTEDPVKLVYMGSVMTIIGHYGSVTATAEQHVCWTACEGIDTSKLLFVCGNNGLLYSPTGAENY